MILSSWLQMLVLIFGPCTYLTSSCRSTVLKTIASGSLTVRIMSNISSPEIMATNYPVPLSPPLPATSKEMELSRAMSASSRSALFSLSRNDVIYEDQWLMAVNKPAGVYCEALLSSVQLRPESNVTELHLANRLDRDTSGVMLITKSHKIAAKLVKAFTDHKIKKTYLAFCIGKSPKWKEITVKSGHGRSKFGAWRIYALSDVGRALPGGSLVRDMQTYFEILSVNSKKHIKGSTENSKSEEVIIVEEKSIVDSTAEMDEILLRACPQSGRTHQIRLHCQYFGISIRGDVKYEGVVEWKDKIYEGHQLHAESLSFEHPVSGLPVIFRAPLPLWAREPMEL